MGWETEGRGEGYGVGDWRERRGVWDGERDMRYGIVYAFCLKVIQHQHKMVASPHVYFLNCLASLLVFQ